MKVLHIMQGKGFRTEYVVIYIQNIGIRALPLLIVLN